MRRIGSQRPVNAILMVGALAVLLAGCTRPDRPVNWQHATKSADEQSQDVRACRAYARRQVELSAGLSTDTDRLGTTPGGGAAYNRQMRSYDLGQLQSREFNACMRRLGYSAPR